MRHWSHLKVGQRVRVEIAELGFPRLGTVRYIGGVNGYYALNHKYYMPSLESGEGLEPWIGLELDDPLPFRQSHHGRENCGRFWFSCAQDCGYWAHAHQIHIIKRDAKEIGSLERRKKTTTQLGPIMKSDIKQKENGIRSFYEPYRGPVVDDSDSEDELEEKYLEGKYGRKLCYGCDDDFRARYSGEMTENRKIYEEEDEVQRQIDNALETVRRSKKYLESIDSKNHDVKSAKVIKDSTEFGMYLDSLKEQNKAYAKRLEQQKETPRMPSPTYCTKTPYYPKNQTLGGPTRFRSLMMPGTTQNHAIPIPHSDTFLMTY